MLRKKILALLAGVFLFSTTIVWADPPAPVPKTWQKTCWTSGGYVPFPCLGFEGARGQDGFYQKGVGWDSSRFTDHGDGTVTDTLTGLMWTKDADLFGLRSWDDAITDSENLSLGQGGCQTYADWRLPNVRELMSLIDYENRLEQPCLPRTGHPFVNVPDQDRRFWSSTTSADGNAGAWAVSLGTYGDGYVTRYNKAINRHVWPVRGPVIVQPPAPVPKTGQTTCYDPSGTTTNTIPCPGTGQDGEYQKGVAWPVPRFTDHGDGTVMDNLTGLMWTKDASLLGAEFWDDAITDAENLGLGQSGCKTHIDWRLPNVRELMSLIDYGRAVSALPNGHPFVNVQSKNFWTSTTGSNHAQAWDVEVGFGGRLTQRFKEDTLLYVWPVRGP